MCGIVGQLKWGETVNKHQLNMMRDTLLHRGPDDKGTYINNAKFVGLGHRRLSILDLSEKGSQPMSCKSGRVTLVFNGMIANYKALRDELAQCGYIFLGSSDTEVILNAYLEWGRSFLNRLRGMFSVAIWDEGIKCLLIARDHFGIKPLYYTFQEKSFYFASELKAFYPVETISRDISQASVRDFLFYRYTPYENTIWKGIYKVLPGECLTLSYSSWSTPPRVERYKYWCLTAADHKISETQLLSDVANILDRSVVDNLNSDVPFGVFLSGGFDSSTIAYLATRNGVDVNTYSIGFDKWDKSEHIAAAETASYLGTRHHEEIITIPDDGFFDECARIYDNPFGGTSFWPTSMLCQSVRKDITVALSGDGGDEIFAGYNWYPKQDFCPENSRECSVFFNAYMDKMTWSSLSGEEVTRLLGLNGPDRMGFGDLFHEVVDWSVGGIKALQKLDIETFLPDVVLSKVDRAAMAAGLEVRVPYLDPELVELVFSIDASSYVDPNVHKPLLQRLLPAELAAAVARRPKQGFSAPVGEFMSFNVLASHVLASKVVEDGILDKSEVSRLVETERFHALYALNVFACWYNKWGS